MRRSSKKNPWSFKIDYDKAIAEDERLIALYTNALNKGVFLPEDCAGASWSIVDLLVVNSALAESLGVSRLDLGDLMIFADYDVSNVNTQLVSPFHGDLRALYDECAAISGAYRRGAEIYARLRAIYPEPYLLTASQLTTSIKRFRTDLARHKRNKLKHGN